MKIIATDFESFFINSGIYQDDLRKFDNFMKPFFQNHEIKIYSGKSITMIGYGEVKYKTNNETGVWPIIGVAPQKHGISLYIAAKYKDTELAEYYNGRLGKAQYGRKTIRFKKFEDLNKEKLAKMITLAIEWQKNNENTYGRNCAKPL